MTVYLLHFGTAEEPTPYRHAGHYTGSAADLDARLARHEAGRGARLLAVAKAAGISWTLARTWPGGRARERQLKNQGGARRHCPLCGVQPRQLREPEPEAPARAWSPDPAPAYQFEDWPALTARATAAEAAELAGQLARGAQAAYETAAGAWSTSEYDARFDTATEVEMAAQKAARETAEIHGRDPAEPVGEWIARTRQAEQGGAEAVSRVISAQADAGTSIGRIERHSADTAAWLFSEAVTAEGEAFARGYDETARSMVAELREAQQPEPGRAPVAATLPDGAPHADPWLAARGWQAQGGIYQRRDAQPAAEIEREAG